MTKGICKVCGIEYIKTPGRVAPGASNACPKCREKIKRDNYIRRNITKIRRLLKEVKESKSKIIFLENDLIKNNDNKYYDFIDSFREIKYQEQRVIQKKKEIYKLADLNHHMELICKCCGVEYPVYASNYYSNKKLFECCIPCRRYKMEEIELMDKKRYEELLKHQRMLQNS